MGFSSYRDEVARSERIEVTKGGAPANDRGGSVHENRVAARELPDLATVDEVAAWLKASRKAIYAKAERGTLSGATYIGRRLYFLRSELLRCALQGRVPDMEK